VSRRPRKQCKKCPWRVGVDAREIPDGYCRAKHEALVDTIATPGELGPLVAMACHEAPIGAEIPCVGWLINQLGDGNNIALRIAVARGQIDANVEAIGPQHEHFEDTLPDT
jgi:hypothetical protein